MNEITINWHIIHKCNYSCDYCFAKYEREIKKELHESKNDIEIILNKIYNYFSKEYVGYSIRLNIAGGEPLLSKNLGFIIQKSFEIGFKVSLITNAAKLTRKFIETNAKYISMFAISIDSLNELENSNIGRVSKKQVLKTSKIIQYVEDFRILNPQVKIKINSVVNRHNYKTYLGDFIDLIRPYKWKVFQALSMSDKVYCSDAQFNIFLNEHKSIKSRIYSESNDDMIGSYIMIDPYGRFYQNSEKHNYDYSLPILKTTIEEAFTSIKFDKEKYDNRYNTYLLKSNNIKGHENANK